MKIFGCEAFVHTPKEKRTKLDNKSIKCIFLGYADGEFGYRLGDLIKSKVIRSRDGIFNELEMFKKPTCDMKVKKLTDWFVEQQENILALQENSGQQAESGGKPAEDDGQPAENYWQQEEEALQ